MDLPVVDETGLEGEFNFKLSWNPDNAKPSEAEVKDVSIFDAVAGNNLDCICGKGMRRWRRL